MILRAATVADALAVETVRVNTWKVAYRGLLPDSLLDGLTVDAHRRAAGIIAGSSTTLLALEGPHPVGMAAYGPCRDDDLDGSELYALYVLPRAWRSGTGTAMLAACGDVTSLWVLEGNARAIAFYARHGFSFDGVRKDKDLGGPVVELRMVRSLGWGA